MKEIVQPIVPVVVIDDASDAEPLAEAMLAGGLDVVEITFRTAAAPEAISRVKKAFPDMLVGAGTVVTPEQAQTCLDLGVDFGLAPGLNPEIVKKFQANDTLFVPGVMTPSEIEQGLSLGCKLLKFFPAGNAGGVKMLKALAGPYQSQGVSFCPTGGINVGNMQEYLAAPVVRCIGGSWLAARDQIKNKQWGEITAQVKEALALAASAAE
ncbi:bifunctional 4-hydroxy-2-oxoglutarate aldolase/2-dehydro-3-deoxy-phosphogluconate aldolase [Planctomycetota bacterium]|nr:bifunctional 4-hydroxy-2-oxoglutarate aldolase/2-dehydro-3-deoxy-phosphogluconate aldolase [Planctomycetota bacterium]